MHPSCRAARGDGRAARAQPQASEARAALVIAAPKGSDLHRAGGAATAELAGVRAPSRFGSFGRPDPDQRVVDVGLLHGGSLSLIFGSAGWCLAAAKEWVRLRVIRRDRAESRSEPMPNRDQTSATKIVAMLALDRSATFDNAATVRVRSPARNPYVDRDWA